MAWFSLSIAMVDHGGGKHIWSLTYNDYLWFNKVSSLASSAHVKDYYTDLLAISFSQ